MKTSAAKKTGRKPRADAQRNRERILEVAKQVFTRRGAEASMDEIAKRAKIGPGTLYRHFPARDELLAAVYIMPSNATTVIDSESTSGSA
jgi:AcrR family transcriptional regulator